YAPAERREARPSSVPRCSPNGALSLLTSDGQCAGRHEAAGGEFAQDWNLRGLQQLRGLRGVLRDDGFEGIPIHARQVVVTGVLRVRNQAGEDVPALLDGQALQRG